MKNPSGMDATNGLIYSLVIGALLAVAALFNILGQHKSLIVSGILLGFGLLLSIICLSLLVKRFFRFKN